LRGVGGRGELRARAHTEGYVGAAVMPDGSIDVRDPEGAVAAMSAARRASLDQLFKQMDLDGNGTIDKREFEMAVTSATMRKFFKVIDAQISEDGEITPEEWLKGMGLIGRNMGDAEFNRLLNEMVGDLQTASARSPSATAASAWRSAQSASREATFGWRRRRSHGFWAT